MIAKIIKIGNSRGIRLSREMLADISNTHSFAVKKSGKNIILTPIESTLETWEKQVAATSPSSQEKTDFVENKFDIDEWEW